MCFYATLISSIEVENNSKITFLDLLIQKKRRLLGIFMNKLTHKKTHSENTPSLRSENKRMPINIREWIASTRQEKQQRSDHTDFWKTNVSRHHLRDLLNAPLKLLVQHSTIIFSDSRGLLIDPLLFRETLVSRTTDAIFFSQELQLKTVKLKQKLNRIYIFCVWSGTIRTIYGTSI